MSKRYMLLSFIAIVIFTIPMVVLAQDGGEVGDPFKSDPDNWCDPGEQWGDGQCSSPEMSAEQQTWAWKCGWYFARIESGIFQPGPDNKILSNCEALKVIIEAIQVKTGNGGGEDECGQNDCGEDGLDQGQDECGQNDCGGEEGGQDGPPDGGQDDGQDDCGPDGCGDIGLVIDNPQ